MDCIDACVAIDASAALDGVGASDAGVSGAFCPEPPFPCERLCWELDARSGAAGASDTGLAALGEPLIRCALERAAECRAGALETSPPPAASELPVSWTRWFLECAGLPTDVSFLD